MVAGNPVDAPPCGADPQTRVWDLVARAMKCLETDRAEARRCLRVAHRLLGEESERRCVDTQAVRAMVRPGGLAAWQVRRAIEYIEEHLGSKLVAANIAAEIGLSKGHFSRAFKTSVGSSPMAYVAARRVERAKLMMSSSDERLAEVALVCGFSDQSHLNRHFQRLVGSAPGRWRRSSQHWPGSQRRITYGAVG